MSDILQERRNEFKTMFTNLAVKDVSERVVSTFLQVLLGLVTTDVVFNALAFDWVTALTVAGSAAVVALIKNLVAVTAVNDTVSPGSLVV